MTMVTKDYNPFTGLATGIVVETMRDYLAANPLALRAELEWEAGHALFIAFPGENFSLDQTAFISGAATMLLAIERKS